MRRTIETQRIQRIKETKKAKSASTACFVSIIVLGLAVPLVVEANPKAVSTVSPALSSYTQTVSQPLQESEEVFDKNNGNNKKLLRQDLSAWTQINEPKVIPILHFPIHTGKLSPGKIISRKINLPMLSQPVFVIGADELSIDWLKRYAAQLKAMRAVGILVEANSEADVEKVEVAACDLPILPVSGDIFAEQLSIDHYPVLISRHSIEQEDLGRQEKQKEQKEQEISGENHHDTF